MGKKLGNETRWGRNEVGNKGDGEETVRGTKEMGKK